MNELICSADGTVTVVGDSGSVSGILAELVKANTTPAVLNDDGSIKIAEVVPAADTLAVEITADDLKTHAWRVPKARTDRLEEIRATRNAKLKELDVEYQMADEGVHPDGLSKTQVAANKQALRDLPPTAESHLAGLNDTDAIAAYKPLES
jgi:allophanate hydrolase subunit 1